MLRIAFWIILWTVVNLLLLYLLMKKFLFGRVIQVMEQRKALIDSQFASAGEAEKKALDMKAQYEKSLSEAKETSVKILDQAKADGQAEYQRIVDEAGAQAGQMIAKAQAAIDEEKKKALKEMESEIASLAVDAAEKILKEKNSPAEDQMIYDAFLSEAGGSNEARGN